MSETVSLDLLRPDMRVHALRALQHAREVATEDSELIVSCRGVESEATRVYQQRVLDQVLHTHVVPEHWRPFIAQVMLWQCEMLARQSVLEDSDYAHEEVCMEDVFAALDHVAFDLDPVATRHAPITCAFEPTLLMDDTTDRDAASLELLSYLSNEVEVLSHGANLQDMPVTLVINHKAWSFKLGDAATPLLLQALNRSILGHMAFVTKEDRHADM